MVFTELQFNDPATLVDAINIPELTFTAISEQDADEKLSFAANYSAVLAPSPARVWRRVKFVSFSLMLSGVTGAKARVNRARSGDLHKFTDGLWMPDGKLCAFARHACCLRTGRGGLCLLASHRRNQTADLDDRVGGGGRCERVDLDASRRKWGRSSRSGGRSSK